jgi:hypothetical protein
VSELVFDCIEASVQRHAVTPGLVLRLRISDVDGESVSAIALRCQVRVEPHKRPYTVEEADRLNDLFGDPDRWVETVKPMHLTTLSTMVPGFTGSITIELPMPCTYDLEIASTKYFTALSEGVIPLLLLFSGTVFRIADGRMQVHQVPWSKECEFPLPVAVFREMVDAHFPNSAWFRVQRETMEALRRFKSRNALPTWDSTFNALLDQAQQPS